MDDAMLVEAVAAQYIRNMGPEAIRYLQGMQELAAGLLDIDSARAWRDIEGAAHMILLAPTPDSDGPRAQPLLRVSFSDVPESEHNGGFD